MQASGRNDGSEINQATCYHCGKQGHVRRTCPARSKWCSFHRSTTHSEEERRSLQQRNQQTANFAQ
ncbi:unnamed protein product [Sphacelaria rigidula]